MDERSKTSCAAAAALEKELLLHEAVIVNDAQVVRQVLREHREGLNVNCRNNYGRAPIHLAASRGNVDILELLVEAGGDIEASDKFGMRPLHLAAWYGQRPAAELLLRLGARASAVDKRQRTLLMMAARAGCEAEFLERLAIAEGAEARDAEGATALHHAARAGQPRALETLARLLPDLELDARDLTGQTALQQACAAGQLEAAACLLELGACPTLQDEEGRTALHLAALHRESRVCGWLLERGGPELPGLADRRGQTALHVAAALGCTQILQALLEHLGREALERRCLLGNTPLHLAAQHEQPAALELLLQRGAPLGLRNEELLTPLQVAARLGRGQACRLLEAAEEREAPGPALRRAARSSLASIAHLIARTARLDYPQLLRLQGRALFKEH